MLDFFVHQYFVHRSIDQSILNRPDHQYLKIFPPARTSCDFSSKFTFVPVRAAAVVIMHAIACAYPACAGAFVTFLLRTHSIQLRMCCVVVLSPPVLAVATVRTEASARLKSGRRFACMFMAFACRSANPPCGETVFV